MEITKKKLYTIKDVARLAGVSVATASRAISGNGYVSVESMKKVRDAIEKYSYYPNSQARSLVTRKSGVIGLVVPFINSPFFVSFVDGVQLTAKKHGYRVLLCYSENNIETEDHILQMLCEQRVDGIIAVPVNLESTGYSVVRKNTQIPVVLAMRKTADTNFSTVAANNYQGSYQAVTHLIEHGHTKIGFIVGDYQHMNTFSERWSAARQAMADYGLTINPKWVGYCEKFGGGGEKAIQSILQNDVLPTAIYSDYQLLSVPVVMAIQKAGLRIPEDISVCAFDGFEGSYCEGWLPVLNSNIHPSREIGVESVKILFSLLDHGGIYHKVIDLTFYDRGTVADIK